MYIMRRKMLGLAIEIIAGDVKQPLLASKLLLYVGDH